MAKITLSSILAGFSLSKLNANFQALVAELQDKVLYRDNPTGEPNSMNSDLDMNSKRILNLPVPLNDNEAARIKDVDDLETSLQLQAGAEGVVPIVQPTQVANGSAVRFDTPASGAQSTKSFFVYLDGVKQKSDDAYSYDSGTGEIILTSAPANGVEVDVTFFSPSTIVTAPSLADDVTDVSKGQSVQVSLDALGFVTDTHALLLALVSSGFASGERFETKGRLQSGDIGSAAYIWRDGNQSANVTAKPARFFPPNDRPADGSTGAFELIQFRGKSFDTYADLQAENHGAFFGGQPVKWSGRDSIGDGGEGEGTWHTGDQSANVAADETPAASGKGGIWVAPTSDLTGASGAVKRLFVGAAYAAWYGADGSGDDTAGLVAWAASTAEKKAIKAGSYTSTKQITFTGSQHLEIDGDLVTIDCSTGSAAGDFTGGAGVVFEGGALVALPALTANVVAGASILNFTGDPGLSEGDVVIVSNPADFSWNTFDAQNKAGEMLRIKAGGTATVIYGFAFDTYAFGDVDAYKLPGSTLSVSGGRLHVIAPDSLNNITAMTIARYTDVSADKIEGSNSGYASLFLHQCYNFNGHDWIARQWEDAGGGNDYGLVLVHMQKVKITGDFYGRRHAVSYGGGAFTGAVVCREMLFEGSFSNEGDSDVKAFDAGHAHAEYVEVRGVYNGGLSIGGDHHKYSGRILVGTAHSGIGVSAGEIHGLNHDLSGIEIVAYGDPSPLGRGVFDVGGNSVNNLDSKTVRGGILRGPKRIYAPDALGAIKIVNRGAVGLAEGMILDFSETIVTALDATATAGITTQVASGDNFDLLKMENYHDVSESGFSILGVDKINGFTQSGTDSVAGDTGATFVTKAVTFPKKFPAVPRVTASLISVASGGDLLTIYAYSATTTGFTADIRTINGTTFDNTNAVEFTWQADS